MLLLIFGGVARAFVRPLPETPVAPRGRLVRWTAATTRETAAVENAPSSSASAKKKKNGARLEALAAAVEEQQEVPSRTRRLRDAVWSREAMDDLVAAEFALRLELSDEASESGLESSSGPDFERLSEQLARRVVEVGSGAGATAMGSEERDELGVRMRETGRGLDAAALRQAAVREKRQEVLASREEWVAPINETLGDRVKRWSRDALVDVTRRSDAVAELGRLAVRSSRTENRTAVLYVRGDGSVDWEGALQGARAATAFSRDLWRRINGVVDDLDDDDSEGSTSYSEVVLNKTLKRREAWRDAETRRRLVGATDAALEAAGSRRRLSEILATRDLPRSNYRAAEAELRAAEARMALADLDLALERACAVLEADVDRCESDLDRRAVAEFSLLDAQVVSLLRDAAYDPTILEPELAILSREVTDFCTRLGVASRDTLEVSDEADALLAARRAVVDAELASVASADDNFFFRPLRQPFARDDDDEPVFAFPRLWVARDRDAAQQRILLLLGLGDKDGTTNKPGARLLAGLEKIRAQAARGLAFYADGSKLLAADVAFCLSLLGRAFNGETLAQREVRVLRRTLKDLSTTVPFIIILLIPLSPIGHVLVFGAIQRFFPEFFPSCYTERRQNLVRLYSSAERYEPWDQRSNLKNRLFFFKNNNRRNTT
ncbi:hypothetical protein CTAYLR_006953 [Chrysophaeum taylorii]|uniref:Letm1 RBD domain-containing protein n=1 Tax=Chrysophaeum taylorii TaxID=2483200 RepID=A0AAD7UGB9_9STRA|nr:hypothetical protein CTAYLR_006953 [Chrysophaeum taylorii]